MRRNILATLFVLVAFGTTPLLSHDFWLVPLSFHLAPGAELVVLGQTSSSFPATQSAVTADRVTGARLISARTEQAITGVSVSGNSLRLAHRPTDRGQVVVATALHPRSLRESPESFRRYLVLEGAPEALERYERMGILPRDSITRRYAKYAKALVEVGEGGPRAFGKLAGHPLEFVPLTDPVTARTGATLRFRLLFNGAPLPRARGHASTATSVDADSAFHHAEFESDAQGEFSVKVAAQGLWNVRALHIVPAPVGSGADWDVHWATLVWQR